MHGQVVKSVDTPETFPVVSSESQVKGSLVEVTVNIESRPKNMGLLRVRLEPGLIWDQG